MSNRDWTRNRKFDSLLNFPVESAKEDMRIYTMSGDTMKEVPILSIFRKMRLRRSGAMASVIACNLRSMYESQP
jgi:hypothetical protein